MDIHKPKPIHSWREFVSEIAVIVVGIFIALTGEQIVERLHENHVATEAREQIRGEIATNLAVLGNRLKIEPCLAKRFAEIHLMVATAGSPTYVAPSWIGRPDVWDNQNGRWQAASQSGRVALLKSGEQLGFSFIYGQLAQILLIEADERQQWSHLEALAGVAHPSSMLIDATRPALMQAMADDEAIRVRITESKAALRRMKIPAVRSPIESDFDSVCIPTNTSTEDGYKQRKDAAGVLK